MSLLKLFTSRLIVLLSALLILLCFSADAQKRGFSSQYKKPLSWGLFFLESKNESESRALVLSPSNGPIPPKPNEPDAPTKPGYYLSYTHRIAFERVEIVGKYVYFRTRTIRGVRYEFRGTIGSEIEPAFSDTVRIPFIKGKLIKRKNGKIIKNERAKFGHAIVA